MLRRPPRRPALVFFVLFLAMTAASALWHPLYSAPDEPTHVIRAAAVARGQFRYVETTPAPGLRSSVVRVPRVFADSIYTPQCYIFRPDIPASCAALPSGRDDVDGFTYTGRYPPLAYLVIGFPTLLWKSNVAVYAMRLVGAALCSLFLAQALAIALRLRRPLLAVGIAVATTPMVIYLAGLVNPNGPEIAAAVCLWTALVALGVTRDLSWRGPLLWVAVSGAVVATARPSGPLWVAAAAGATAVAGVLSPVRPLLRSRTVQATMAVVALGAVSTIGWIVSVGGVGLTGAPIDGDGVWLRSLGMTGQRMLQLIGYYGWLDAPAPRLVFAIWGAATIGLLVLVFRLSPSRRHAWTAVLLVVGVILLPLPFEMLQATKIGLFWQSRYTLPVAVGVPILAAAAITDVQLRPALASRLRLASGVLLGSAHVLAIAWGIRRFAVGNHGPALFFSTASWEPPLPHGLLAATFAAAVAGLGAYVARAGRRPTPSPQPAALEQVG